jgi:hypothetical protein
MMRKIGVIFFPASFSFRFIFLEGENRFGEAKLVSDLCTSC